MSTIVPLRALPNLVSPADHSLPSIRPLRRRPNPRQGRALETLAHAIEYLADMRLWEEYTLPGDAEAMRLLMHCSRSVFNECATVVPLHLRVMRWFNRAGKPVRVHA